MPEIAVMNRFSLLPQMILRKRRVLHNDRGHLHVVAGVMHILCACTCYVRTIYVHLFYDEKDEQVQRVIFGIRKVINILNDISKLPKGETG
jgi:hypothetical protein